MASPYCLSLTTVPAVNLTPYAPLNAPSFTGAATFAGPVLLPDASPALSFANDTDSGLARPASDTVAVVCGGRQQFRVAAQPSAVNMVQAAGAPQGDIPTLSAQGTDGSISLGLARKGEGNIHFIGADPFNFGMEIGIRAAGDRHCYMDLHAQAGVDYSTRIMRSAGTDGILSLNNSGVGGITMKTGTGNAELVQFAIRHQSTAVNYLTATGGKTGMPPSLAVQGTDASIDLSLQPQGAAGRVRFGNFVAESAPAIAGSIEIRDAAGTLRRLAVLA